MQEQVAKLYALRLRFPRYDSFRSELQALTHKLDSTGAKMIQFLPRNLIECVCF